MDESGYDSSDQANGASYEPPPETPFSLGENSSTTAARKASIARSSATKGLTNHRSLFDKRIRSLIAYGLVRGITPGSIRRECGAKIPDFVSSWRDGDGRESDRRNSD